MVWIEPSWLYPEKASLDLKDFTWVSAIQDILFTHANTQIKDAEHPYTPESEKAELSLEFLKSLWKEVENETIRRAPEASQPAVETVDSMQGRETKLIILNFTISDASNPGILASLMITLATLPTRE